MENPPFITEILKLILFYRNFHLFQGVLLSYIIR